MAEPEFQRLQRQFAAHIRDPACAAPEAVEDRRLKIYQELFYNNVEGFLANGFPVLHSLIKADAWHAAVRGFLRDHACESPYFIDIPAQFLDYLSAQPALPDGWPGFALELAHYEYMEVAVGSSTEVIPESGYHPDGDLLAAAPLLSPLACLLSYHWPVHRISPSDVPDEPLDQPVWLLVYRDRQHEVQFMEVNQVTARLFHLLEEEPLWSGRQVLTRLGSELGVSDPGQVIAFGLQTLQDLRDRDVILGTRLADVARLHEG